MFGKKCKYCNRKIDKNFEFCPYCGNNVKKEREQEDFGLLGRTDNIFNNVPDFRMPFGFNTLFNSLLKQIDKQFKDLDKQISKEKKFSIKPASGISISISTSTGRNPEIKIRGIGEQAQKEAKLTPQITDEKAKLLSKLPKKEAEARVRRLAKKIIYELNLPGVNSIKDIIINKLENSIEIKAFSKDKAYFKLIPLNLPILNYKLEEEKLILELKPESG